MEKNKGTIPEFITQLNPAHIGLLNELLAVFGRLHGATTNDVLQFDGDEFIPTALSATSLSVKIGSTTRDTTIASGDQAVTGIGFQPDVVLFLAGTTATDEFSIGWDDGTNKGSFSFNVGTWYLSTSFSIYDYEAAGTLYQGVISAKGSDGFTITWTKTGAPSGTLTIMYLALKV